MLLEERPCTGSVGPAVGGIATIKKATRYYSKPPYAPFGSVSQLSLSVLLEATTGDAQRQLSPARFSNE